MCLPQAVTSFPSARGATPVDFAYRIHTEVGNHCAGARVNGRIVPLDTTLENGDIVEIITQKKSHPNLDWLNFAVTPRARNRIRQWYKRSHRDENMARGRDMLEKELARTASRPCSNLRQPNWRQNAVTIPPWMICWRPSATAKSPSTSW
jgi:(p)ppGpp synthase/HD superfamily hydrolase